MSSDENDVWYQHALEMFARLREQLVCHSTDCSFGAAGAFVRRGDQNDKSRRLLRLLCRYRRKSITESKASGFPAKLENSAHVSTVVKPVPAQISLPTCLCTTKIDALVDHNATLQSALASTNAENRHLCAELKSVKIAAALPNLPVLRRQAKGPTAPPGAAASTPAMTAEPKAWAEITKASCPAVASPAVPANIVASKKNLLDNEFFRRPSPSPTAVYFGRVQHGPIGQFRCCLLKTSTPPSSACLAVSFIGTSTCEVLCHEPLCERLVAR